MCKVFFILMMVWDFVCVELGRIFRFPGDTNEYGAGVEWYCQGKAEELGDKPVPVPLLPPQIAHGR